MLPTLELAAARINLYFWPAELIIAIYGVSSVRHGQLFNGAFLIALFIHFSAKNIKCGPNGTTGMLGSAFDHRWHFLPPVQLYIISVDVLQERIRLLAPEIAPSTTRQKDEDFSISPLALQAGQWGASALGSRIERLGELPIEPEVAHRPRILE